MDVIEEHLPRKVQERKLKHTIVKTFPTIAFTKNSSIIVSNMCSVLSSFVAGIMCVLPKKLRNFHSWKGSNPPRLCSRDCRVSPVYAKQRRKCCENFDSSHRKVGHLPTLCYCAVKQFLNNLFAVGRKSGEKIFVKVPLQNLTLYMKVVISYYTKVSSYQLHFGASARAV